MQKPAVEWPKPATFHASWQALHFQRRRRQQQRLKTRPWQRGQGTVFGETCSCVCVLDSCPCRGLCYVPFLFLSPSPSPSPSPCFCCGCGSYLGRALSALYRLCRGCCCDLVPCTVKNILGRVCEKQLNEKHHTCRALCPCLCRGTVISIGGGGPVIGCGCGRACSEMGIRREALQLWMNRTTLVTQMLRVLKIYVSTISTYVNINI